MAEVMRKAVCALLRPDFRLWPGGKANKTNTRPGKWNKRNRNKGNTLLSEGNRVTSVGRE